MKSIVYLGLGLVMVVNCVTVRAEDTAAQAAARAALEQKLKELEPPQAQPPPRTSSWDTGEPASAPATTKTNTVQAKPAVPQTTPAAAVKVAAPTAPVASSVPSKTQPAAPAKPANAVATAKATAVPPKAPVQQIATSATTTVTVLPISVASPAINKTPPAVAPAPAPPAAAPASAPARPKPAVTIPVVKKSSPSAPAKPAKEIVTVYGTVYKNAQVEKVDADGIIISYSTASGGMGMTKVYFTDLPDEVQRQYK